MNYIKDVAASLKRLSAFWDKGCYDRPPIIVRFPAEGDTPEEWSNACMAHEEHYLYWDKVLKQRASLCDDYIPTAAIDLGPSFMAGILGAEMHFINGTSWSEHILRDWSQIEQLEQYLSDDKNNTWLNIFLDRVQYFVEKCEGKYAVGLPNLTGPGDIMTALRGPTDICMDFHLYEEEIKKLGEICTNAWLELAEIQFNLIPKLDNGYCDYYGYWTPGRSCFLAEDISALLSPEMYMEFLFPLDCRAIEILDISWYHIHSAQARLIPYLLKLPKIRCIQVVNDRPAGPELKEILPFLKMVQKDHCVILRKYKFEELLEVLPEFRPEGLMIDTFCSSLKEAEEIVEYWNRNFRSICRGDHK